MSNITDDVSHSKKHVGKRELLCPLGSLKNMNVPVLNGYIYIYREYYTVARRYEFMFEWREQPLEHKIYFFELTCNFLFIIWTINIHVRDGKADLNTNTGY